LVFHKAAGVHLTIGINNHRALLSLAIDQEQLFGLQPCMHAWNIANVTVFAGSREKRRSYNSETLLGGVHFQRHKQVGGGRKLTMKIRRQRAGSHNEKGANNNDTIIFSKEEDISGILCLLQ
jgi:hypothetical protein